jgi:hypothetical protein
MFGCSQGDFGIAGTPGRDGRPGENGTFGSKGEDALIPKEHLRGNAGWDGFR